MLFTVTRGRGEANVSVAPRHAPGESHLLGPVVAALDRRHLSDHDLFNDFGGACGRRALADRLAVHESLGTTEQGRTVLDGRPKWWPATIHGGRSYVARSCLLARPQPLIS